MTVLCGLGGLELEAVGGGRRGDVSVEVEAMADIGVFFFLLSSFLISLRQLRAT